ncbi:MAG: DUF1343 domain-containing protein [Bacteroidia bacterium]|nr:DUF1343 domain-containing protein [Bacteroidia bacterium]
MQRLLVGCILACGAWIYFYSSRCLSGFTLSYAGTPTHSTYTSIRSSWHDTSLFSALWTSLNNHPAKAPLSPLPGHTSDRGEPSMSSWWVFREEELPAHRHKRWVLIAHRPTYSLVDSLAELGVHLVRVYVPEHGLFGEKAAGTKVQDTTYRGIPVVSLYGPKKAPTPEELRTVDAILFALREVGVRHYTYLSTLAYVLKAAAEAQRPVWVLDFPNPHAHYSYGPLLEQRLTSFVGLYPIPLVPGLTIGEYAQLLVGERYIPPLELRVIPWKGWRRGSRLPNQPPFFTEPPSPALRSPEAIELYPILGWYEGTCCISVGRGTPHPFEQVGIIVRYSLPRWDTILYGYRLRPVTFKPGDETQAYHGWHIKRLYPGPVSLDSLFRLGFFLLKTFKQSVGPNESFYHSFFDKLFGSPQLRHIDTAAVESLYQHFRAPVEWIRKAAKYHLYEGN